MFGTILFRMILWELLKVFSLSLIGITGILLMGGIIVEASQQGLGPLQILMAIPLLVPSTMPYTIPATTLFATCVVYGRLTADNEILAIKASGVNLIHVVKPALILGGAMSLVTMALYFHVIPTTHHILRSMVFADAEELLYSVLRKNSCLSHGPSRYTMFVKAVQGKKLIAPVIKRKGSADRPDIIAVAREAELRVDMVNKVLRIHMRFGTVTSEDGSTATFIDRVFEMNLPDGIGQYENRPRDMTWDQIIDREGELDEQMAHNAALITEAEVEAAKPNAPATAALHLQNLRHKGAHLVKLKRLHYVERLMRLALSMGCLGFVLVGCPIGIWFSRSDYLSAFITCFLPIVVIYYPMMLCFINLAKEGRSEPMVLAWIADVVIGVWGILMFWRLLRN